MREHDYYTYILTNKNKTVLYIGVTNDIIDRIIQHMERRYDSFTARYGCCYLVHLEHYTEITEAIQREKQLKKWSRKKKEALTESGNPKWRFMNDDVLRG